MLQWTLSQFLQSSGELFTHYRPQRRRFEYLLDFRVDLNIFVFKFNTLLFMRFSNLK